MIRSSNDDKKLEELVNKQIELTRNYLQNELNVLENVASYDEIINDFIGQLQGRVRKIINKIIVNNKEYDGFREAYLVKLEEKLKEFAANYDPVAGEMSYENIGNELLKLAEGIASKKIILD